VKTQQAHIQSRQRWLIKPILAQKLQSWLIDAGSLTARLQNRYRHFSVKPVVVAFAKPNQDEIALLDLPAHKTALIREVLLLGEHHAVVFAHSVLPRASLRGAWHGLGRLGHQPLGGALFANPKVKRTLLTYKKLSSNHELYLQALKYLEVKPPYLWARRSTFNLNCAKILVTEVFLPALHNEYI
jgi:chorismate lyase